MPDNVSLLPLPPYSPQLNPVENVWQVLRQNHLSNRVYESDTAIVDACCTAWNALVAEPARITSIATRKWAAVINEALVQIRRRPARSGPVGAEPLRQK